MSLTAGSQVGPYEIVAPLGAGGMGEVYRARATRLNRDVAVKILPPASPRALGALASMGLTPGTRASQAVSWMSGGSSLRSRTPKPMPISKGGAVSPGVESIDSAPTSAGAIPFDTTAHAHATQRDVYRRIGGRGRLDIMFGLNATVRRLAMSGIRARHPDYTDAQVRHAHARLLLGDSLARAVWPEHELVDP